MPNKVNEVNTVNELSVLPPGSLALRGACIEGPVMHFAAGLAENDWLAMDPPFQAAEQGLSWWRGDWYNYGEAMYQHFAQALDLPTNKRRTYQNEGSVCGRYTPEERAQTWMLLSFGHHASVAYVDKRVRSRLLQIAIREDWSVKRLRDERDNLRDKREQQDAADDMGAGTPGNEEYLPVQLPITVKAVASIIHDHLSDLDDMIALRAWLTQQIGDEPPVKAAGSEAVMGAAQVGRWIEVRGSQEP